MGIGNSDIRIDIPQGKQNEQQVALVMDRLEHDTAIKNYTVLTTKNSQRLPRTEQRKT